jgi:hypothetical protein
MRPATGRRRKFDSQQKGICINCKSVRFHVDANEKVAGASTVGGIYEKPRPIGGNSYSGGIV